MDKLNAVLPKIGSFVTVLRSEDEGEGVMSGYVQEQVIIAGQPMFRFTPSKRDSQDADRSAYATQTKGVLVLSPDVIGQRLPLTRESKGMRR